MELNDQEGILFVRNLLKESTLWADTEMRLEKQNPVTESTIQAPENTQRWNKK